ncbi:hypothetical protein WAI453_005133 [Rhynchosporium graminicola]|uniref:Related to BNS1 protein n=1 Tax=Rhynchosporium graminicola TaxID=2792576 RepID=A0A1E1LBB1_9HELO|nr:related to BNS1 protein [Rhynchosporium commune]
MSSNVLADRDVNAAAQSKIVDVDAKPDVKSMEYHRQVLQSKLDESKGEAAYISPSDNIMSPCTAKLSAYRSKQLGKAKPRSLFAKTSAKNLSAPSKDMFGNPVTKPDAEDQNMGGQ